MNAIYRSIRRPATFRRMINLWPPFLAAGIRVDSVSPDWRRIDASLPLLSRNANYVGTHFGGNIFSMADPFYVIMLINILGPEYLVWDRRSVIEYVKPGRGLLRATFELDDETVEEFKQETKGGEKFLRDLEVYVYDEEGDAVAHIVKTIYVRRKKCGVGRGDEDKGRAMASSKL